MKSIAKQILIGMRQYQLVISGFECSGSTFVYQIASSLGIKVLKDHDFTKTAGRTIATYRDPRDVLCSYAKRQMKDITAKKGIETGIIESHNKLFLKYKRHEDIYRHLQNKHVLLIRYEDYFLGREALLVDTILGYLSIDLEQAAKAALLEEYSLEKNKKRAQQFGDFEIFDKKNFIHGGHISNNGMKAVWKQYFTPQLTDMLKRDLGQFLIDFSYEKDHDW